MKFLFLILCLIFNFNILMPGCGASSLSTVQKARIRRRESSFNDQKNYKNIRITCECPNALSKFLKEFTEQHDFTIISPPIAEDRSINIQFPEPISYNEVAEIFDELHFKSLKVTIILSENSEDDIIELKLFYNIFNRVRIHCESTIELEKFLKESDSIKKLNNYIIEDRIDSHATLIFEKSMTSKKMFKLFHSMKNLTIKKTIVDNHIEMSINFNDLHIDG